MEFRPSASHNLSIKRGQRDVQLYPDTLTGIPKAMLCKVCCSSDHVTDSWPPSPRSTDSSGPKRGDLYFKLQTSKRSKSNCIIDLVRAITILTLKHNFSFTARHIAGLDNSIADSLSHFQMDRFCHLAPNASPSPASSLHQRHQFNSFCLFLLGASLAPATKHSYSVGQNHFISFCLMQGLISPSTPRPSPHFWNYSHLAKTVYPLSLTLHLPATC